MFTHMTQVGNSEHEANGIQYIRFSRSIKTSDRSELWIEFTDFGTLTIRLETI